MAVNIFVMLMRVLLSLLLIMALAGTAAAQSKKKKKKRSSSDEPAMNAPTSVNPNYPPEDYGPKKTSKKRSSSGPTYESQDEYEARMRQTVKTIRKNEKLMEKPQYSDPMYFGHKRPPKKRPPGKMKFCKVCGIRH